MKTDKTVSACIIYSFKFPWISTIFSCVRRKSSFNLLWNNRLTFRVSHNLWPPQIKTASSSHWQESRSRKISRRNDSIFSRSLEKIGFSFLFLFLIFKIFRNLFYFSSRFMRFFNPFSFSFQFSRFLRKNSRSLLDCWDSETQISFSSRFSRFWEKFLLLFSISEIPKNKTF